MKYDIKKELKDIYSRMYGTNFEQDRIVIVDAIKELDELNEIRKFIEPLRNVNTHNETIERLKEIADR